MGNDDESSGFKKIIYAGLILIFVPVALLPWISFASFSAIFGGVMLGVAYILSSVMLINKIRKYESSTFIKTFFIGMAIRLLLAIIVISTVFTYTKIDEIFFTVSFIFSYLCTSIPELIFINKII